MAPAAATDLFSLLAATLPGNLTREQLEQAVRTAYEQARAYMANAGADVQFEITGMQTLEPSKWDTILWTEIASYPEGFVIDVEGVSRSHTVDGVLTNRSRAYEPHWRDYGSMDWSHPELKWVEAATAREGLKRTVDDGDNPDFERAFAITTYEVSVSLAERKRDYRAAFVWFTHLDGSLGLAALDRVTQRIGEALAEQVPPEGLFFPTQNGAEPLGSTRASSTAGSTSSCMSSTTTDKQATGCPPCVEGPSEPPGLPDQQAPPDGTPIVIDLDRGGLDLTSLEEGVYFDIDGDGLRERVSWTREGVGDAFLVLDRNGNGIVDDASELFGDVTKQAPTEIPNGYLALAPFDSSSGGNGDGTISADDPVFPWLRLWVDANHDGVSQLEELISLAEAGIVSIDLDYVTSERRDRHGNRFRYKGLVTGADSVLQSADVFLLVGEEQP